MFKRNSSPNAIQSF